jgi:hypothetical protein
MLTLSPSPRPAAKVLGAIALICLALQPPTASAWGNECHRMINRLVATSLPAEPELVAVWLESGNPVTAPYAGE